MIEHLSHWTRWATTTSYPYGQNRRRLGPKRNRSGPTTWPPSTPGSLHSQVWHCLVPANSRIKNQKNQPATDFISWLGWRENIATVAWSWAPTMHVLAFEVLHHDVLTGMVLSALALICMPAEPTTKSWYQELSSLLPPECVPMRDSPSVPR